MIELGNLFKKIESVVYETSLDGSIVKKVFDPKGNEISDDAEIQKPKKFSFASFFTPRNFNGLEYDQTTQDFKYTAQANGRAKGCDMTATMKDLFPRGASHNEYPEQYDGT